MRRPSFKAVLFALAAATVGSNATAAAKPGHVLSAISETVTGGTITRIVYESTGLRGEPIQVSGFVVVPDGPVPVGGRPIVAWAHPTVGVASKCAPSLGAAPLWTVPGLSDMIRRGFIVTASDYPGLGIGGIHPFLVGASEGPAVLDSVRAARELAGRSASNHFAIWGFSQGGHAALFAGAMARRYAPDLHLDGVAVAEPATALGELIERDLNTPVGKVLTSYTLYSWSKVYHVPLEPILGAEREDVVADASQDCLTNLSDILDLISITKILKKQFLLADLNKVSPWRELIKKNSPTPPIGHFPIFLAQGTLDQVVSIKVTNKYVARLCASGSPVDYFVMPGVFHATATIFSTTPAIAWIASRFAGEPPPNSCGSFRPS